MNAERPPGDPPGCVRLRQEVTALHEQVVKLTAVLEAARRAGGRLAWMHTFVSQSTTCYVIDPTRSHQPAEQLLDLDWSGTLVHDSWRVYDRFTRAAHR